MACGDESMLNVGPSLQQVFGRVFIDAGECLGGICIHLEPYLGTLRLEILPAEARYTAFGC
jgi:hypothetical protein